MGAGPRLEPKLQPGPSKDTRLFFDARQATQAVCISVFTVSCVLYIHINNQHSVLQAKI